MTLDETIDQLETDIEMYKRYAKEFTDRGFEKESVMCEEGANERKQLADWLKELKMYRRVYHAQHAHDYLREE